MSTDYSKFEAQHKKMIAEQEQLRETAKKFRDLTADQKKQLQRRSVELAQEIGLLEMTAPGVPPRAMVLVDPVKGSDSAIFLRGEAENRGPIVPRRFLEILSGPVRHSFTNGSGRLELAAAIANPANPLTARVLVNRVWQHHFGEGVVPTPDDLGTQSEPPSHPELLDYLARRFMTEGWSLKKLHRTILLSSVYQQTSATNERYATLDPRNRLLWRANIRRLELEAVRDSILAIGGSLDLTPGGRPVRLNVLPYSTRRTLYGFVDRQNLPEIYTQFDFANPATETGKRFDTLVPQQALFLMNSPLVIEQARKLVEGAEFTKLTEDEARVRFLYNRIYQREPTVTELRIGYEFLRNSPAPEPMQQNSGAFAKQGKFFRPPGKSLREPATFTAINPSDRRPLDTWAKYSHALLQANEALFVN